MAAQTVEWLWTLIPAVLLTQIAAPSLLLLYIIEDPDKELYEWKIKVIGRQWYWSYSTDKDMSEDINPSEFDAYILRDRDQDRSIRLLDVDNRVYVPITPVRIYLSSRDVIHSWTVPSLGVKSDCIPGRLNDLSFSPQRPGVFYGQCSEICGANHRFIPIVLRVVDWIDLLRKDQI